MSKLVQDLKSAKGFTLWLVAIYCVLMLWVAFHKDEAGSPDPYLLNEVLMLPLLVLVTTLFFQRELSGTFMEIYVTFPVSLVWMVIRKFLTVLALAVIIHLGWYLVYLWRFGKPKALIFPYFDAGSYAAYHVSWGTLFIQALPAYLLFIALTIAGIVVSKRLYGGVIISFSYWLFELTSSGYVTKSYSLFTAFLKDDDGSFLINRLALTLAAVAFLSLAMMVLNRRERWIMQDEPE